MLVCVEWGFFSPSLVSRWIDFAVAGANKNKIKRENLMRWEEIVFMAQAKISQNPEL